MSISQPNKEHAQLSSKISGHVCQALSLKTVCNYTVFLLSH